VIENGQAVDRRTTTTFSPRVLFGGSEIKDGYPEFTLGVLKKLGWDKISPRRKWKIIRRVSPNNPEIRLMGNRPFRRHSARGDRAWLCAIR